MNPSTGERVASAPNASLANLDRAVAAAKTAFADWSRKTDAEMQEACGAVVEKIAAHAEELARLVTLEQGKPL